MKNKQLFLLFMVLVSCSLISSAQNHKYYVRAISNDFNPKLEKNDSTLIYIGEDRKLKSIFAENNIYVFEKAFTHVDIPGFSRIFYIETDSSTTLNLFLEKGSQHFEYGEYLGKRSLVLLDSYPDDYGNTSPVPNNGLPVDLFYLDFAKKPMAWDYTTGNSDIKIGISDGYLVVDNPEFINKTEVYDEISPLSDPEHGTGVTGIAAAQGDNSYGITGVCYDCNVVKTRYTSTYDGMYLLHKKGAKVINCSWSYVNGNPSPLEQDIINKITSNGTMIVASSGNGDWNPNSIDINYPASYDNVISVSSVGHINELDCDNIVYTTSYSIPNVKNYVGGSIGFPSVQGNPCNSPNVDLNSIAHIWPVSTATLNDKVDILAPGGNVFKFGQYVVNDTIYYSQFNGFHTSSAAPQVSGAIGLMKSLNECLSFNEAESILKISSFNIDNIQANQQQGLPGNYGSGSLQTGTAVQLTNNLMDSNETAYLENQKFNRWDFIFNGVSKNIVIQNQEFTEASTLTVNAKNVITIEEGTLLEPNSDGYALLEIDPNLVIDTNCYNPSSAINTSNKGLNKTEIENKYSTIPSIVETKTTISKNDKIGNKIHTVRVYNMLGVEVYSKNNINDYSSEIDLSHLITGIYIIKGLDENNLTIFTEKIIKK